MTLIEALEQLQAAGYTDVRTRHPTAEHVTRIPSITKMLDRLRREGDTTGRTPDGYEVVGKEIRHNDAGVVWIGVAQRLPRADGRPWSELSDKEAEKRREAARKENLVFSPELAKGIKR